MFAACLFSVQYTPNTENCTLTDDVLESLLLYIVKNTNGAARFAYSMYERLHPEGVRHRPLFNWHAS